MKTFTREDTKFIKGLAIILMFYHHLFSFPDRLGEGVSYFSFISLQGKPLATGIGAFGKICVALFVFLSGYGTYISVQGKDINKVLTKKLKNLYILYWRVFVIFVPVCMIMNVPKVQKDITILILNFLGISITYNDEISFFTPFVLLMMFTPVILKISKKITSPYVSGLLIVLIQIFGLNVLPSFTQYTWGMGLSGSFLYNVFILPFPLLMAQYLSGIFCAKYNILSWIKNRYSDNVLSCVMACIICLLVMYMRIDINLSIIYDFIFAPVFTAAVLIIFENKIGRIIRRPIEMIGKQSTIMWLVHSYYCYALIQKFIYFPKFSLAIVLLLLAVSYATSVILNYFFGLMEKYYNKMKNRKSMEKENVI